MLEKKKFLSHIMLRYSYSVYRMTEKETKITKSFIEIIASNFIPLYIFSRYNSLTNIKRNRTGIINGFLAAKFLNKMYYMDLYLLYKYFVLKVKLRTMPKSPFLASFLFSLVILFIIFLCLLLTFHVFPFV